MKGNIIGLGGRKGSGKTELANVCVELGYEKKSFATALKKLVGDLMHLSLEEVNKFKDGGIDFTVRDLDTTFIANETHIPLQIVKDRLKGKRFLNTRDALQYIGTDLIRSYNNNWHVERTLKDIEKDKKYVFDDVRFPNEKKAIEDLGGDCWFVVREKFDNVSNHDSEIGLTIDDFGNNLILNYKKTDINELKSLWKEFIKRGYEDSLLERDEYINAFVESQLNGNGDIFFEDNEDIAYLLLMGRDISKKNTVKESIPTDIEKVYVENETLKVLLQNGTVTTFDNLLVNELLKKYL